jgi:hypothetical protein
VKRKILAVAATGRTRAMTGSLAFDGAAGNTIRSLIRNRSQLKREACTGSGHLDAPVTGSFIGKCPDY